MTQQIISPALGILLLAQMASGAIGTPIAPQPSAAGQRSTDPLRANLQSHSMGCNRGLGSIAREDELAQRKEIGKAKSPQHPRSNHQDDDLLAAVFSLQPEKG